MKVDDMREEYGPVIDKRKKAVVHNLLSVYKLLRSYQEMLPPGSPLHQATEESAHWVQDYRDSL